MRRLVFILLGVAFLSASARSQKLRIGGVVSDTIEHRNIANAVVCLLRSKDSVLIGSCRTDGAGRWKMDGFGRWQVGGSGRQPDGLYLDSLLLLISADGYIDFVMSLPKMDSTAVLDLAVGLTAKARLLDPVIVRRTTSGVKLKGDTLEFDAGRYSVPANAPVEDLLKKFPGIQIDKDGKITVNGQAVQQVLVDGEEFFGDDPTLVTRNVRADVVEKVQVYDKRSEQAAFTGIDDGKSKKTMDVKLKADKKNGFFGKLNVGAGTDGLYDNTAMFNRFRNDGKLAFYGIVSNTGKTGLNRQEQSGFGDNSGISYSSGNLSSLDTWDGNYDGNGFPRVVTGGLHYDRKWSEGIQSMNANYKFFDLQLNGASRSTAQYILPDASFRVMGSQDLKHSLTRNKLNGFYEIRVDSANTVKLTADAEVWDKSGSYRRYSGTETAEGKLINENDSRNTTREKSNYLYTDVIWKRKFRKPGRSFSMDVSGVFRRLDGSGYFYTSDSTFKDSLSGPFITVTDQYKSGKDREAAMDSRAVYSEPITSTTSVLVDYGWSISRSLSSLYSSDKTPDGKYGQFDSLYSNDYRLDVSTHRGGAVFFFKKKRYRVSAGADIGVTSFDQQDKLAGGDLRRSFVNPYPQVEFGYSRSGTTNLTFTYTGVPGLPSIRQMQSFQNNIDPMNIAVGNPDLKPSFSNNLHFLFTKLEPVSGRNTWIDISFRKINDAIGSRDFIDSAGRRTYQAVNVDGNYVFSGFIGYRFKLPKPALSIGANASWKMERSNNIVNGVANNTNSSNYSLGLFLSAGKARLYDVNFNAYASFNRTLSSIGDRAASHYLSYSMRPEVDFYLPYKTQLHTDGNFVFQPSSSLFPGAQNVLLWNVWAGKKLMKNEALLIKVSVNDVLNNNKGIARSISTNYLSQTINSVIRRWCMVSVLWNFNTTK